MIHILEFLSAYPLWTVFIIAVITIYATVTTIGWIKGLWQKRKTFQQNAMHEGEVHQAQVDQQHAEEQCQNDRIKLLEDNLQELTKLAASTQKQTDMLTRSDKLNIKAWIKEQHEKWMQLQCIDSQSLELICDRYDIYKEEGGNSWAEKLVNEIKALPVVIVIPTKPEE